MAIKKINLGAPVTGVGGDKYRDAHTKVNDNFTEVDNRLSGLQSGSTSQGVEITALKAKDASQDTAIATKANTSDVNAKNTLQDNAIDELQLKDVSQDNEIALKANITDVDAKNLLQDNEISTLQSNDLAHDAAIALKANKDDVDAKNASQDTAINLRAVNTEVITALDLKSNKSDVDSKNALQDSAITTAQNKADAAIPNTDKGAVNGVATLDADGKVTSSQLPDVTPVAWGSITGNIADQSDLSELYFTKTEVDEQLGQFDTFLSYLYVNGGYYDTTTTAYPNVNIAADGKLSRSTATFGTAATMNVGEAAGNVMEVGVFGLGSNQVSTKNDGINPSQDTRSSDAFQKSGFTSWTDFSEVNYGAGISWSTSVQSTHQIIGGVFGVGLYHVTCSNNDKPASERIIKVTEILTKGNGGNTTQDANGFLRDSNSIAEAVVADATGNVAVASIQAGIGAPKIAYKKLTGTSGSTNNSFSVAHGLNAAKILSISVSIFASTGNYTSVSSTFAYWHDATNVVVSLFMTASNFANRPFTILITYEV